MSIDATGASPTDVPPHASPDTRPLSPTALNSYSARLEWLPVAGTETIKVYRGDRLIDIIDGQETSYTDYLLWPQTTYAYTLTSLDEAGRTVQQAKAPLITPPQSGPFPRLYASTSFWNTPIPNDPAVDPDSSALVSLSFTRFASSANLANNPSHGYPIAYADPSSKVYNIGCTKYDCETNVSFRIPSYARANSGSDRHLVVIDPSIQQELDLFGTSCCWTASSRYVTATDGWGAICRQGEHCNGAVAAGFAEAGGVIRPEEIAQGHIDHALAIATPYTRYQYIACPATHTDGKYSTTAIPEGAHVQLDPKLNVDTQRWPRWVKVIATALQTYGAYVSDTSGSLALPAEGNQSRGYDAWAEAGVSSTNLTQIPWSRLRVLKLVEC